MTSKSPGFGTRRNRFGVLVVPRTNCVVSWLRVVVLSAMLVQTVFGQAEEVRKFYVIVLIIATIIKS